MEERELSAATEKLSLAHPVSTKSKYTTLVKSQLLYCNRLFHVCDDARGKWSGVGGKWGFTFHLGRPEIGNPKVWRTYQPTYQLTGVGSRDTCVSKKWSELNPWQKFLSCFILPSLRLLHHTFSRDAGSWISFSPSCLSKLCYPFGCLCIIIREGIRKKIRKKSGLLPNQGGGLGG